MYGASEVVILLLLIYMRTSFAKTYVISVVDSNIVAPTFFITFFNILISFRWLLSQLYQSYYLIIDKIVGKTQLALFRLKTPTLNTLMFLMELYEFKF